MRYFIILSAIIYSSRVFSQNLKSTVNPAGTASVNKKTNTYSANFPDSSVRNHNQLRDYLLHHLQGYWNFCGNATTITGSSKKSFLFTANEVIIFNGDSLVEKINILQKTSLNNAFKNNQYIITLSSNATNENWLICLPFSINKKNGSKELANWFLLITEPDCYCSCPYEVYERTETAPFVKK